jgi:hypothetical protein
MMTDMQTTTIDGPSIDTMTITSILASQNLMANL